MKFEVMSEEAQEVAKCIGQFRKELEDFIKPSSCEHQWYWDYACSDDPPRCLKCGEKS